ncbi:MAG: AAA family ATPase, partial [Candidatus Promineifilaceae bacterium]
NTLPLTAEAIIVSSPYLIDTLIPGSALLDRALAYAPTKQEWHSRLIEIIERGPASSLVSGAHQSDIFEQYSQVLAALARCVPLVLVVDDLQWADLGSISLLFHLGRQIKSKRILIVCAYRPEEVALGREGERHPLVSVINEFHREYGDSTVNVDEADSFSFIDDLLDSEPNDLGQDFRSMFYRLTHGNPLFTLELLLGMQERGDIVRDQYGTWVEGQALDWETLPARVEAVIAERIGRLDRPLRAALRVASVEGDEFTAEAVARVRSADEREMLAKLSRELDRKHRLIRAQSIMRIDGQLLSRYRFRHILFQKYLYGSLDEVERVYLHEQVGNVLEDLYQVQVERPTSADLAPQLARHFLEARIIEKAVFYLRKAGERSLQLSAYQEAVSHFDRVLTVLMTLPESPERDQQELAVQLALGIALQGVEGARHPALKKAYTRAYELCQQTAETTQIGRMQGEMVEFCYVGAEYLTAREIAREALTLAQKEKTPLLEAMAFWYLGFIHFALGEFALSHDYLAQVISFYEPQTHHDPFIALCGKDAGLGALAYDACCLWCLGYPDQAYERSQESLALARELGQPFSMVDVLAFGGCVSSEIRRDWGALKEHAERIVKITADQVPGWRGTGEVYLGEALVMMGKIPEGIEQIRQGLATKQTVEALCYETGALGTLALAEGMIGNPGRGLSTLAKAITLVEQTEERYCEAELYRLQGKMHHMMGDEDEAISSFMKAIDVARRQNARSWELRTDTSLARLWRKQGKISEAHELLKPVYDWFTEGFETPDLKDAKTLLEELSIVGQY